MSYRKQKINKYLTLLILILIFILSFGIKLTSYNKSIVNHEKILPLEWDTYLFADYSQYIISEGFLPEDYPHSALDSKEISIPYEKYPLLSVLISCILLITDLEIMTLFSFTGIFLSSFSIFLIFLIIKKLLKNNTWSLIGALFYAINNYVLYRGSVTVPDNSYFIIFPLIILFIICFLKENRDIFLYLSSVLVGVGSLWHESFMFTPLLIFLAIILGFKKNHKIILIKRFFYSSVLIFFVSFYNNNFLRLCTYSLGLIKRLFLKIIYSESILDNAAATPSQVVATTPSIQVPGFSEWLISAGVEFIIFSSLGLLIIIFNLFYYKHKNKKPFLFIVFYILIILIILQLLPLLNLETYNRGFLWIAAGLAFLMAYIFKIFYLKNIKYLLVVILSMVFCYSLLTPGRSFTITLNQEKYNAMLWLKNNTQNDSLVIAPGAYRYMLFVISKRELLTYPNVKSFSDNFFLAENAEEFTELIQIVTKNNDLKNRDFYIYYLKNSNSDLFNEEPFKEVFNNSEIVIYKIKKGAIN